jgi:hypothetical protein
MYRAQSFPDSQLNDGPISKMDWGSPHQTPDLYYDMVLRCFLFVNGNACDEPRDPLPIGFIHIPLPRGFAGLGGRAEEIEGNLRLAAETPSPTS